MGSNRSNSVGSSSTGALAKLPNDAATIQKMEQFPLVLSDATMPEEDLSLKFLALVFILSFYTFSLMNAEKHRTFNN